jgi:hypothetical protein
MSENEILLYLKEMLEDSRERLTRIEGKLDSHSERIARLEEQHKSSRGAIATIISLIITALGWIAYKAKF